MSTGPSTGLVIRIERVVWGIYDTMMAKYARAHTRGLVSPMSSSRYLVL